MGSGETSPTMVKTHRDVFARLEASAAGSALLLDTPFGFQENADQISARAVEYFRESVGTTVEVASFRRADVRPAAMVGLRNPQALGRQVAPRRLRQLCQCRRPDSGRGHRPGVRD